MPLQPKKEISNIQPPVHGGINLAELSAAGLRPEDVIDFSVCCNPYPPVPGLLDSLKETDIQSYPDSGSGELRRELSRFLEIEKNRILVGSGSTELIRMITQAYLEPGDRVLIAGPTYSEYELASRIAGAEIIGFDWCFPDNPSSRLIKLCEMVGSCRPKIIFLCNPNNPTGHYLSEEEVREIFAAAGGGLLVIDEAYVNFVEDKWRSESLIEQGDVVILRSMTKDCGLAGLRLGYALADPRIIEILRRVCPPWNVSAAAQKAGITALSRYEYYVESFREISKSKSFLVKALIDLGYRVYPSRTNYFLVDIGDASAFRHSLLKCGILVRDCASFGLPQYIRVGVRTQPECEKFIDTVKKLTKEI